MAVVMKVIAWVVSLGALAAFVLGIYFFVMSPHVTWMLLPIACSLLFAIVANPITSQWIGLRGKWGRATAIQLVLVAAGSLSIFPMNGQAEVRNAIRDWELMSEPAERAKMCYAADVEGSAAEVFFRRYHYIMIAAAATHGGDASPAATEAQSGNMDAHWFEDVSGRGSATLRPLCAREFPTVADAHVVSLPSDPDAAAMMCVSLAVFFPSGLDDLNERPDAAARYRGLIEPLLPVVERLLVARNATSSEQALEIRANAFSDSVRVGRADHILDECVARQDELAR